MLRAYKYRLYPNMEQIKRLQEMLDRCRELYNAALQERRDAYRMAHISIGYTQQAAQLPALKEIRPEYAEIHSQVLQDTLRRVEKAFAAFFRRVKQGETPGYPRFQGYSRYDSFTYPQSGFSLTQDHRICLSKIGTIKVKVHRELNGRMKTCTIKREGQHWYVIFICDVEQALVYHPGEAVVGVDLGLLCFATLSDGSTIDNPRCLRRGERKLKRLQAALSRKKRGSLRRRKAAQVVGKNHRHIRNQRRDFHHKQARKLVNRYQTIVFEKLQPTNMSKHPKPKQDEATGAFLPNGAGAKAGLNKSIYDAGWVSSNSYARARQDGPVLVWCWSTPGIPAKGVAVVEPSSRKTYQNAGIAVRVAANWTGTTTLPSTSCNVGCTPLRMSSRLGRSLQGTRL